MASPDVALPDGTSGTGVDLTQARARARARVPALPAVIKTVRADVAGAWPWTSTPPALAAVRRTARTVEAPADSATLRGGWIAWNHVVAIPVTAVAYLLAWLAQHPGRAAAALLVAATLALIWAH